MKKPPHRAELKRQDAKGDQPFLKAMVVALPVGAIALSIEIFQLLSNETAARQDYYNSTGLLYGILYATAFMFAGAFCLWRLIRSRRRSNQTPDDES